MRSFNFLFVPVLVGLFFGCAHTTEYQVPPKPTEYYMTIDSSFSVMEQQLIVDGADAWAAKIPDITWTYTITDRASIEHALDTIPPAKTLYVIRTADASTIPAECVILDNGFGCYKEARMYLPEADLNATKDMMRVTMHLAGHFFKLPHSANVTSVMQSSLSDIAFSPSPDDIKLFCQYNDCPLYYKQQGLSK